MRLDVLLFAAAREAAGCERLELQVGDDATVADVFRTLAERSPALSAVLPHCRAALDQRFAARDERVEAASTLAVLPPVSGG